MTLPSLLCTAAFTACLVAPAAATVVQGTVTDTASFNGYMGLMTDISVVSGSGTLPDTGFAFCIDVAAHWADAGSTRQYTIADSFAPFLDQPAAADQATALLHYVVDYYYAPLMNGDFGTASGYGFNQAVWELISDFDGTAGSLSTSTGHINNARTHYALYDTILGDLRDNFAFITPGYRSTRYDILFLAETDRYYQSVGLVTEKAASNEVPEPSTLALMLAVGFGLATRRARRPAKA